MAKATSITSSALKVTMYFLLLAITLQCANSARILDEVDPQPPIVADEVVPQPPIVADPPELADSTDIPDVAPVADPTTTLPSGQFPAIAPTAVVAGVDQPPPDEDDEPNTAISPVADVAPVTSPATTLPSGPNQISPTSAIVPPVNPPVEPLPETTNVAPVAGPVSTTAPSGPAAIATTAATVAHPEHPLLSFFMHDILGGTNPSARVVTGIIANSGVNGLPFSKTNGQVFPINGGVPLPNNINGIINNNNNIPFLTGFNSGSQTTTTILQNNGNNNVASGGNQPFVTGGQLPSGATLQQLMFGSVTVIDDELTEGHELGSAVIGQAQGFYLASSLDGTSQTIALTALFHGGDHHDIHDIHEEDTVSFFGVHRTASPESQIAVVGGTGKYENAKGYATIGTIHMGDQHTTDGVDTILQINVYLSH